MTLLAERAVVCAGGHRLIFQKRRRRLASLARDTRAPCTRGCNLSLPAKAEGEEEDWESSSSTIIRNEGSPLDLECKGIESMHSVNEQAHNSL